MTVKPTMGGNRADGYTVTAADWNNDVEAEGLYVQEVLAGSNADKIPLSALSVTQAGQYQNLLVNPSFENWNRGATSYAFTPNQQKYTADRWLGALSNTASAAATVQRESVNIDPNGGSQYAARIDYTHQSGASFALDNVQPDMYGVWKGLTMTFAFRVNSTMPIAAGINDSVLGIRLGTQYTLGSGWVTLSVTAPISSSAAFAYPMIYMGNGLTSPASGLAYVDNCQWYAGSTPVPSYYPLPFEEDLRRCRRYFQQVHCSDRGPSLVAGQTYDTQYNLDPPMSAVPTSTITAGSRTNVNTGTIALGLLTATSFYFQFASTAGAISPGTDTWVIDDVVTLETA